MASEITRQEEMAEEETSDYRQYSRSCIARDSISPGLRARRPFAAGRGRVCCGSRDEGSALLGRRSVIVYSAADSQSAEETKATV